MHLGRIILLAGASLAVAMPCAAQTTGLKPGKVQVLKASKGPQEAISAYKRAKQEALKKMVKLAGVPPATAVQVGSDCQTYTLVVRDALNGMERKFVIKTTARSGGFVMNQAQRKELEEYIKSERKKWADVIKTTQDTATFQLNLRENKSALKKAAEDAPQQIKALVEELQAAEDRIKEYLRAGAGSRRGQARRFVSTVTGNVEHAWSSIIKAGNELFGKKELKPDAVKKRMDAIIRTMAHEVGHTTNASQTSSQAEEDFAKAVGDMALGMKKNQKSYKEAYEKAKQAYQPLISGSAAQAVPTFRDAKPDQLKARAQQQMQ